MDSENRLGKLLPKSIKAKRRQRKSGVTGDASSDDIPPRGRSTVSTISRETTESDTTGSLSLADEEGDKTSLICYDSDPDSSATRPTAISTHPSQIGYLTTNSPLVQAEHISTSQPSDQQPSEPSPRSSTFPTDNTEDLNSPPHLNTSKTELAPPRPQSKRSVSPAGRFRDVFRSKKGSANSSTTGSPSPERRPTTSDAKQEPSQNANGAEQPDLNQSAEAPDTSKTAPTERFRRLSRGQKIDTTKPPRTPPTAEKGTPVIVNTPPTPTDSSHSAIKDSPARSSPANAGGSPASTTINSSPTGSMIAQRRGRAGSATLGPSKLSNITSAPLTPTPESGATTPSGATSGFFTSMISAAQNAANTLSNTITNTNIGPGNNKSKVSIPREPEVEEEDHHPEVEEPSVESGPGQPMDTKEPAIKTLGLGDLSLSQLGLAEPSSRSTTPTMARFPDVSESRTRSESAPVDAGSVTASVDLSDDASRPRSLYEPAGVADRTTPTSSVYEGKSGIQRSGSIRSAIGRHRKRGSSAATGGTGTTIGAAIAAANASVAHPQVHSSVPKLTGFAVASKKRNRDFHALFKSVPDDDYLIEDYSCALQREILAHGRLYVSEGHLCFSSNILGWVTTLVMSFDEIVSVEKRSTALLFKNGLMISTLHAKHIFASFTSRDSTYDLIVKIWKLGHPSLQSSLNGVRLEETGGDKTEKVDADTESIVGGSQSGSASDDESEDGDDVYDEDEEDEHGPDSTQPTEITALESEADKAVTRKPSGAVVTNGAASEKPQAAPSSAPTEDFPGPATHAPTDCGDAETHYDRVVGDDVVPAPLGKVYNLLFGPASVTWMSNWLTNDQKCMDLQMEDKKGLSQDNKSRTYSYIKPLYSSIGPKQTKCIVTEAIEQMDLEKAVNVTITTQTPDVPSGNIFSVKTKYCLSWAENNSTRMQVNCTIEWTGKSWLKGPIEKGANDGQTTFCKDIFASLKAAVTSRPRSSTVTNGAAPKGKRKGKKKAALASNPTSDNEALTKPAAKQSWGIFEPLHGILGPVLDILMPLLTGNVVYGLLVGLLVASWFGFGFNNRASTRAYGHDLGFYGYPDRVAAYEEMWRREESEVWEWLEERVGLDRLGDGAMPTRKRVAESRTVDEKLREDRMDEREIKEAIKVTEEKLKVLKSVIDKKQQTREEKVQAQAQPPPAVKEGSTPSEGQ